MFIVRRFALIILSIKGMNDIESALIPVKKYILLILYIVHCVRNGAYVGATSYCCLLFHSFLIST